VSRTARALATAIALAGVSGCAGPQLAWYGHTPDRAHRIEVRQEGNVQWLALDGRTSRAYRFIAAQDLASDPDGGRLAFAAEIAEHPERWAVVTDFVQGRSWDAVAGLHFGPGGRRLAYAALDGRLWRMVVDGVPEPPFDAVDTGSVTFSPDGRRIGYVADDGRCARAVVDAVPGPCVARIVGLAVADVAGQDVSVVADAPDGSDAHVRVGADRVLDLARARELVVDRAVRHWAVVAGSPEGWRLVVDGREGEPFEQLDRVVWSPGGRSVAYAARRDGAWHVVTDGRVGAPYAEVEEPVFAASGAHVGYIGRDEGHSVVAIDDRVIWESPAPATALALSDDGAHVAWVYRDGASSVIAVDGERYRFDMTVERTVRFTHDGEHWAALAGSLADRRLFVVVDGHVRLPFDAEELFGSPAGDAGSRLGGWVSAELERYVSRARSVRGS
jgi:hypothetical protein